MRRQAAVGVLLLVLSGCAGTGSPKADLQTKVNDLVSAANGGNAADTRTAADLLLREIQSQSANATLTATRAETLTKLTSRILAEAGVLEPVASKAPEPSLAPPPTLTPTPSRTPPPSPSPTPTPVAPAPSTPLPSPSSAVVPSVVVPAPSPSGGTG